MAILRIMRPPMGNREFYDKVQGKLDIEGNPPDGLILHTAGEVDGQWQIVDVWESPEHAQRFDDERLTPVLTEVLGSPPPAADRTQYDLHNVVAR